MSSTTKSKKCVEIYKKPETLPLVTIIGTTTQTTDAIKERLGSNYIVKVLSSVSELTNPEEFDAHKRSGGFYSAVFEKRNYSKQYVFSNIHYKTNYQHNVTYLDNPHKSYIDILTKLKNVLPTSTVRPNSI